MSETINHAPWMEEPEVKSIPADKLAFLSEVLTAGKGKSKNELIKLYMPLLQKAKQNHLTFTTEEVNIAIHAIRKHSTREEQDKINQLLEKIEYPK